MARDVCDGPLQGLLMSPAEGQAMLPAVWAACKEGLTRGLVLLYEKDPQNISRVLEVCQVNIHIFALRRSCAADDQP